MPRFELPQPEVLPEYWLRILPCLPVKEGVPQAPAHRLEDATENSYALTVMSAGLVPLAIRQLVLFKRMR